MKDLKLLDEVSFIDIEANIPTLKKGRIIQISSSTVDKYDIHAEEELPQEVTEVVIIQEAEIAKDDKGKDVVKYNRRSYGKSASDVFATPADARKYMRDLFAD